MEELLSQETGILAVIIIVIVCIFIGFLCFILPIILFFKVWRMTNDMKRVRQQMDFLIKNSSESTDSLNSIKNSLDTIVGNM